MPGMPPEFKQAKPIDNPWTFHPCRKEIDKKQGPQAEIAKLSGVEREGRLIITTQRFQDCLSEHASSYSIDCVVCGVHMMQA
jgi:hypothetical protein